LLFTVKQAAEEVAPSDLQRTDGRNGPQLGSAATILRSQVERSVRTLLVEMADVDAEHVLELATPTIRSRSRYSLRALPTQRSA
jgi:hypothetical protein